MSVAIGANLHMNIHFVQFLRAISVTFFVNTFKLCQFSDFHYDLFVKFKMAVRYHVSSVWCRTSYETIYHNMFVCQFWLFCLKYIVRYAGLYTFRTAILKFKMVARYHVNTNFK